MLTTLLVLTICLLAGAATYVASSILDRAFPHGEGFGILPRRK